MLNACVVEDDVCAVTTLLVSHSACLEHDMGEGHPERPDRYRVVERALEARDLPNAGARVGAARQRGLLTRVHPLDYVQAIERAAPTQGAGPARPGHGDVGGLLRSGVARRRRRGLCRRRGDERQGRERLRRHPPARPPRRVGDGHGVLLFQQRRRRRAPRPGASTARSGSPSSISTFTMATARSTSSGPTRACFTPPRTRCRSIPAPARAASAANTIRSSTRR